MRRRKVTGGRLRSEQMEMIRSVVLFTHVVAMIALFAGLALEWLGIVYLMIDKPDIGVSLAIIAIALVFAPLVSLQKRQAQSTFVPGYR
jgi:hypothetical protein